MGYPCRRACRSRVPGAKRREPRLLPTMPLRGGTGLGAGPAGEASLELQVPVGPATPEPLAEAHHTRARQALPSSSAMLEEYLRG
jgi:hypothetical protein